MDTPRCVIFDFGNVIAAFDKDPVWTGLSVLAKDKTPEEVKRSIVNSGLERQYDRADINTTTFLSSICQRLHLAEEKRSDIEKLWTSVFTGPNQPVIEIIRQIRERGEYRLLLASNTNELHYKQMCSQFPEALKLFDGVILSFEIKCAKPERKFFERCIEAAQCDSAQCVYVDDLRPFCEAARAGFGIEAIWYNPHIDLKPLLEDVRIYADSAPHLPEKDHLVQVYQQRFLHYRHLDNLRWQVPLLVVALGGIVLGFVERQLGGSANQPSLALPLMLFVYGIFAGLCSYYLGRISLHHESNTATLQWAAHRLGDWAIPTATTARRPIASAAFRFMSFTRALSGGFIGASLWLFVRHFAPVAEWWGIFTSLVGAIAAQFYGALATKIRGFVSRIRQWNRVDRLSDTRPN